MNVSIIIMVFTLAITIILGGAAFIESTVNTK